MVKIDFDSYERFFGVNDAGFLLADIYSRVYGEVGFLAINSSSRLDIFLDNNGTELTRRQGLKLYTSNEYLEYLQNFDQFIKSFESKVQKCEYEKPTGREAFFKLIVQFLNYYKLTEFFYTDFIFNSSEYVDQQKNIAVIKTKGRVLLNQIFLESKGYLHNLFDFFNKTYGIKKHQTFNLSIDEVIHYTGINVRLLEIVKQRTGDYYILVDHKSYILEYNLHNLKLKNGDANEGEIRGRVASTGVYAGVARVIEPNYTNFSSLDNLIKAMKKGEILVAESTSPEISRACQMAGAIVTNQGGLGSHAAIISREMQIPCIVGTKNATSLIKTGDHINVDANNGVVTFVTN